MAYSMAFTHAVTMVVYIAVKMNYENNSRFLATRYIAEKLEIPLPTASKVLKNLVISGIVTTKEGLKGGLQLAKNPDEITLLDIFTAMEQERPLFRPLGNILSDFQEAEFYKKRINDSLVHSEKALKETLGSVTVGELIR